MRLFDSNILIYAVLQEYVALRQWLIADTNKTAAISGISLVEVLGYHAPEAEI